MNANEATTEFIRFVNEHLWEFRRRYPGAFYGVGFFCDSFAGDIALVANSQDYHEKSFRQFRGSMDEERFRWEIGNWQFPAGLFLSASSEQEAFRENWATTRRSIDVGSQESLERFGRDVLLAIRRLPSSPLSDIQGLIVLGPDDPSEAILAKRIRVS